MTAIVVKRDFSKFPAGRFRTDGPFSGQKFREELLAPALRKPGAEVVVQLDGTMGYGSSFMEEAFGGLVRLEGFVAKELHSRLTIESNDDPSWVKEAWSYIDDAEPSLLSSS